MDTFTVGGVTMTRFQVVLLLAAANVVVPRTSAAEEARDVAVVTSVLDFSVEGLAALVQRDEPLAFRIVIPQQGVVRGQMETRLIAPGGDAVFLETFLYDATTIGNKHLVFVEPLQLPGPGEYTVDVTVAGLRTDASGELREFRVSKRFPVTVGGDSAGGASATSPKVERLPSRVGFDFDSYELRASERSAVEMAAAAFWRLGGTGLLIVEGHTDSAGGAAYNLDLSLKRARAVKRALVASGVPAARIRTYGYGFERLLDGGGGGLGPLNRRAEFVLHPGEAE